MSSIQLKNVSTHNLKSIDVSIPHGKLTVVTGLSGSGKSSLAIDTLYAEGQRRYIESLSPYTRQFLERMEKPKVEKISGILPSLCIEAKNVINNARSTVGTHTEVNDFLRVLFARIGKTFCKECQKEIRIDTPDFINRELVKKYPDKYALILFSIPIDKKVKKSLSFFLKELLKQGFTRIWFQEKLVLIEESKSIVAQLKKTNTLDIVLDRIKIPKTPSSRLSESLQRAFEHGKDSLKLLLFDSSGLSKKIKTLEYSSNFSCAACDIKYTKPEPNLFSFNSPVGACPTCEGFGRIITIDRDLVVPDRNKTLKDGAIDPWDKPSAAWEKKQFLHLCKKQKIPVDVPFKKLKKEHQKMIFEGKKGADFYSVNDFFKYLEKKTYKMHVRIFLSRYRSYQTCPDCEGSRLKPEALQVKVNKKSIFELQELSIRDLKKFLEKLSITKQEKELVGPALEELENRVQYLDEVGLEYLTLNRTSRTLSGGEMQRINLGTALGTQLVDTLYVLDEPSIGLHERDNQRLIKILKDLKGLGNTVVVIEHDSEIMKEADHLIDLGPGAGFQGGKIVCEGTFSSIKKHPKSFTAKFLRGEEKVKRNGSFIPKNKQQLLKFNREQKKKEKKPTISIEGAREHNLKDLNVEIPLDQFVVITGVSGAGKSTLAYDILYKNFLRERGKPVSEVGEVKSIKGFNHIDEIVYVDQSPLGKSSRSCPMSYTGIYPEVRNLFAVTHEAKVNGFGPGDFSFNTKGGRCDACEGIGKIKEEMHFLADVYLECEKCEGKRFKKEVLDVKWSGKNIIQILDFTIQEALEFFKEKPRIVKRLNLLFDLGLGYLTLGQSTVTLSAGEAQRLKLAIEMLENKKEKQLFVFDEPTVGLHFHDIKNLMTAFDKLLEAGHSVVVIEHNMEVIKNADTIIDLGPEGGAGGGKLVVSGNPKMVSQSKTSITGRHLKSHL